jgi:hypothetical protein
MLGAPQRFLLPDTIALGDFVVFDSIGAYSYAVRTNFNGFLPGCFCHGRRLRRTRRLIACSPGV